MSAEAQNTPHIIFLLPALALGSLDAEEEHQALEHLKVCRDCAAEYRAYLMIMDKFPLAAPQVNPPPRLRESIMRQARLSRQSAQAKPGWLSDFVEMLRKPGMVWMAASLGVILLLAIANLYQWRNSSLPAAPTQAYHFNVVAMTGAEPEAQAEGILVISPDGRYGTLVVNGLEPLVAGNEYQLWLVIGDSRVSGGVFTVGSSGYGTMKVESPRPLSEFSQFGITIEPVGGSQQPTGKRVLGSEL